MASRLCDFSNYILIAEVFHKLCAKYQGEKLKRALLTVFAHLFVRLVIDLWLSTDV